MLRDAIVSGRLEPGDHLKENELAEQMAVSRSPVREAFRILEQEGIIEAVPNQGCYVKSFDAKEIEDIFRLRAALENLAYEMVIDDQKLTEDDWKQLDLFVSQQREAIIDQDMHRLTNLDMDFHAFICRKADNERLLDMWQSLRSQVQILFFQRFRALEKVPETVDTDHHEIMAALRNGDIDQLKKINKQIAARVSQECIAVFSEKGLD
jgi:DNA-binding GntR family transcriptional regulator